MEQGVLEKQDRWPMMSGPRKDPCILPTPRHSGERGGNNGKATPFPGAAQGGASLGEWTLCLEGLVNRNQCLQRAHHRFTASEQDLRCRRTLPLVVKSQEDMDWRQAGLSKPCCKNKKDTTADARRGWWLEASWELRHLSRCWQEEMMLGDQMGWWTVQQIPAWTNETQRHNASPTFHRCPDSEKFLST